MGWDDVSSGRLRFTGMSQGPRDAFEAVVSGTANDQDE